MSDEKAENSDETLQPVEEDKQYAFGKKFKYTLDSDEEDDEVDAEKYNVLDNDAIEGTEKNTIEFDGDIKITPFNMDEELETGHFDKEGTYIFKKENEIRDNWLDNIEWEKIRNTDSKYSKDDDVDEPNDFDVKELYKDIVDLIQPGETVRKAIQRYGKNCKRGPRKGQKRKKTDGENDQTSDQDDVAKERMMKLISTADQILQSGDMDIYERTYEQFRLHLSKSLEKKPSPSSDMFSDEFEPAAAAKTTTESNSSGGIKSDIIQWEYKWEDKDDAQIYGPYSSEDMLAWVNQGYFDNGVFVRRTDSEDAKFYTSKRIDFELYI